MYVGRTRQPSHQQNAAPKRPNAQPTCGEAQCQQTAMSATAAASSARIWNLSDSWSCSCCCTAQAGLAR